MRGGGIVASPQTENGWTKIADEILEALAQAQMSGHEWRLVMGLLRQTYGFKKKADSISFSQWEQMTGLGRRRVGEAIKRLEARKIIVVDRSNRTNLYSFQKDYGKWDGTQIRTGTGKRTSTQKRNETSAEKRTKDSTEKRTHNREGKTERQSPPLAVVAYREVASRFPDKALWDLIAETVGEKDADLDFWKKVVRAWIGCGWNKLNVTGMMECYKRRDMPGTKGGKRSGTRNHGTTRREQHEANPNDFYDQKPSATG